MDTIPIDSAIKYFFPHDPLNPNDVRWNTYCNAVSFKEKLPDKIDEDISPYLWFLMHAEGYNNNNVPPDMIHQEFSSFINDVAMYHKNLFSDPFEYSQLQQLPIVPFEKEANQLRKAADAAKLLEEKNKRIADINIAAVPVIVEKKNFKLVETVLKAIQAEFNNNDLDVWFAKFKDAHMNDQRTDDEIYDAFWYEVFESTSAPFISVQDRAKLATAKDFEKFYREFKRVSLSVKDPTDQKYDYKYIMIQEFIKHPQTIRFAKLDDEFDNYAKNCNAGGVPAKTILDLFEDFIDKLKNDACTGITPQKTYAIADDKEVEKIERVKKFPVGSAAKPQKMRIRWDEWVKSYKTKFSYPTETSAIVYVLNKADLDQATYKLTIPHVFSNQTTQRFANDLHMAPPLDTQVIDTVLLAYTHKIKTEQNREIDILDLYELVRSVLEIRIAGVKARFDAFLHAYAVAEKIINALEISTSTKFNTKIIEAYHKLNNNDAVLLPAFEASVANALLVAVWNWILMQQTHANDPNPNFKWNWFESVTQKRVTYDPVLEKYDNSTVDVILPANPVDSFVALFTDPYAYVGKMFKYVSQMPIGIFGKTIIVELNKWLGYVIKNPLGFEHEINVNEVFNAIFKNLLTRVNAMLLQYDKKIISEYNTFIGQAPVNITFASFIQMPNFANHIVAVPPYLAIPVPPVPNEQALFKAFLLDRVMHNVAFTIELEKIYTDPTIAGAVDANGIAAAIGQLWAPNLINDNPIKKMLAYFLDVLNDPINGYLTEYNGLPRPLQLPLQPLVGQQPVAGNVYGVLGKRYISTVISKDAAVISKDAALGQVVTDAMFNFMTYDLELKRMANKTGQPYTIIDDPIVLCEFFIYLTTLDTYKVNYDILYKSLIEVLAPKNIDTDDVWSVMKLIIQNSTNATEMYSVIIVYNDYLIGPPLYNGSQNKSQTPLFKARLSNRLTKPVVDKIYNVIYPPKPITLYTDFLSKLSGIVDSQLAFKNRNKRSPINTYLDIYDFIMEYSKMKGMGNKNVLDVIAQWKQYYDDDKLKRRNIKEDYMIHLYESKESQNYVSRLRDKYNTNPPGGSDFQSLDAFTKLVWTPPAGFIQNFLQVENAKNIMVGGGRISPTTDQAMAIFRKEVIDNFNNLKQYEKDFYRKFIKIITISGAIIKLGTQSSNWENCYVVLQKTNTDTPVPIFSEYIPVDFNVRVTDYLDVYNSGNLPATHVTKTQFDLNLNKLVIPIIITPKNTKLINKDGRVVRVDEQNNVVQFNETCNGTLFHGRGIECEHFYKICITNPNLDKCTDMLQDSYFENAKNPNFVNEMNPETALTILKALGFNTVTTYDTFSGCMRKKIESVNIWKNRNFDTLKNKKNVTMFYKYLDSIVNYINEYSFILNAEPCHQESPMFSPYYPLSGGSPAKQLVLYIKFNKRNRKEQLKLQQPIKVNSDELIQTITNLLTDFFDDLVKKNVKFSYTDIEKINKYLRRIADCSENLAKVSAKLNELKRLHNIVRTTPSATRSEHIINEINGKCKYCSDKISSAEKKLLLVISKLVG